MGASRNMPRELIGDLSLCRPLPRQPAIMYEEVIELAGEIHRVRHSIQPFQFIITWCCRKRMWAAHLDVTPGGGWYDPQYLCSPNHGCQTARR